MTFFLMLLKRLFKILYVYFKSFFLGKFDRHFDGEAVGIVQLERKFTRESVAYEISANLFEFLYAALQSFFKTRFFGIDFAYNAVVVGFEFGIHVLVLLHDDFGKFAQFSGIDVNALGKTNGAAEQSS